MLTALRRSLCSVLMMAAIASVALSRQPDEARGAASRGRQPSMFKVQPRPNYTNPSACAQARREGRPFQDTTIPMSWPRRILVAGMQSSGASTFLFMLSQVLAPQPSFQPSHLMRLRVFQDPEFGGSRRPLGRPACAVADHAWPLARSLHHPSESMKLLFKNFWQKISNTF